MADDSELLSFVKISSMIFMFLTILIVGSLPIRLKAFKQNKVLLAFSAAFSGGLFLSVGLLHLLPEAAENFDKYWEEKQIESGEEETDHFPFAFLILLMSFSFILFIEKIAAPHSHGEDHEHHDHKVSDEKKSFLDNSEQNQLFVDSKVDVNSMNKTNANINKNSEYNSQQSETLFKNQMSTQIRVANRISYIKENIRKSMAHPDPKKSIIVESVNNLTPYILQIAIGIHAVFEGLAIGIEEKPSTCLGIALAVACHKWAEGLTLGLAFRQADVDVQTSTIMITIQAVMNPIGIGIGWALANQGFLITGIFESISAGTFLYIATIEVIVEEFNVARYKWGKFLVFLFAIGFISTIWFLEQLTEN